MAKSLAQQVEGDDPICKVCRKDISQQCLNYRHGEGPLCTTCAAQDVCLFSRSAYQRLSSDQDADRFYGIPLEVFDDHSTMQMRAVRLAAAGKRVLVLNDELQESAK